MLTLMDVNGCPRCNMLWMPAFVGSVSAEVRLSDVGQALLHSSKTLDWAYLQAFLLGLGWVLSLFEVEIVPHLSPTICLYITSRHQYEYWLRGSNL